MIEDVPLTSNITEVGMSHPSHLSSVTIHHLKCNDLPTFDNNHCKHNHHRACKLFSDSFAQNTKMHINPTVYNQSTR